jgi:hypothetical protein
VIKLQWQDFGVKVQDFSWPKNKSSNPWLHQYFNWHNLHHPKFNKVNPTVSVELIPYPTLTQKCGKLKQHERASTRHTRQHPKLSNQ